MIKEAESHSHPSGECRGEKACNPFRTEKIVGVATLGAIVSTGLYFLYQYLEEETKQNLKESIITGFKAALKRDY